MKKKKCLKWVVFTAIKNAAETAGRRLRTGRLRRAAWKVSGWAGAVRRS